MSRRSAPVCVYPQLTDISSLLALDHLSKPEEHCTLLTSHDFFLVVCLQRLDCSRKQVISIHDDFSTNLLVCRHEQLRGIICLQQTN